MTQVLADRLKPHPDDHQRGDGMCVSQTVTMPQQCVAATAAGPGLTRRADAPNWWLGYSCRAHNATISISLHAIDDASVRIALKHEHCADAIGAKALPERVQVERPEVALMRSRRDGQTPNGCYPRPGAIR
jgi:hypothetical protein